MQYTYFLSSQELAEEIDTTHVSLCSAWMYNENWIQRCWQAPFHSYESCSVVHEVNFPGLKLPGSEAALPPVAAH